MKYLFLLLMLMLMLSTSCSVFKHKTKEKAKTEIQKKTDISKMENISISAKTVITAKDSAVANFNFSKEKRSSEMLQNFTLKSNGKCLDGGQIRFVNFTDKNGNKTEIPVNDNTELNFTSSDAVLEENKTLKTEIKKLKQENVQLQDSLNVSKNLQLNESKSSKTAIAEVETKKESKSFFSYVFVAFAAIVFWELGKKYLKPF